MSDRDKRYRRGRRRRHQGTIPPGAEHGKRIQAIAQERRRARTPFRRWLYENGIVIVATVLFAGSWLGQGIAGFLSYNSEREQHGSPPLGAAEYVTSSHFWNATAENWQSEFLQLAMFVVLTSVLRQKGSPESKSLRGVEPQDADPRNAAPGSDAPWPVRRGGVALRIYEHSLSIALALLFAASFAIHLSSGARDVQQQERWHGGSPPSVADFAREPEFWFEVFQNWQSEFLAVAVLVLLTVYLRERGSAQSKPVAAANDAEE